MVDLNDLLMSLRDLHGNETVQYDLENLGLVAYDDHGCVKLMNDSSQELSYGDFGDMRDVYIVLMSTPIFTGLIANLILLTTILSSKEVRSKPFLFVVSIASSDVIFVCISGPAFIVRRYSFDIRLSPVFGCNVVHGVEVAIQIILIYSLTAIAVERYIIICKPLKAKIYLSRVACKVVIVLIWSLAIAAGTLIGTRYVSHCFAIYEDHFYTCNMSYDNKIVEMILAWGVYFVLPGTVMSLCYSAVIYRLWISPQSVSEVQSGRHSVLRRNKSEIGEPMRGRSYSSRILERASTLTVLLSKKESAISRPETPFSAATNNNSSVFEFPNVNVQDTRRRIVKLLLVVVVMFLLCWSSKLVSDCITRSIEVDPGVSEWLNNTGHIMAMVHCTLDPIIFFALSRDFRHAFCRLVRTSGANPQPSTNTHHFEATTTMHYREDHALYRDHHHGAMINSRLSSMRQVTNV